MGKKGKRSRRNAAKENEDKIVFKCKQLTDRAMASNQNMLKSQARNELREAIRILKSIEHSNSKRVIVAIPVLYSILMVWCVNDCHYHAALDCYKYFEMRGDIQSMESVKAYHHMESVKAYHQLLLLRLGHPEWNISHIIDWFESKTNSDKKLNGEILFHIVSALRVNKEFESAILLVKMFGVKYWEPSQQNLSLALTYLEGYRLNHIFMDSNDLYFFQGYNFLEDQQNGLYLMVLKLFLLHKHFDEEENIEQAIALIKFYLTNTDLPFSGLDDSLDVCQTCGQAVTKNDVQLVCSGCHVACYCSLDHQRMTWKKDAIHGMRIGHEILCPLYKVCRKFVSATRNGDVKKQVKMEKRLDRACLKFLSHGLGLKDKCFPCENK